MYKYGRKSLLTIDRKIFNGDNIDIDFKIPFSDKEEPDISEVILWNPSEDTLGLLKRNINVNLSAGYENDTGTLILGSLRTWEVIDHQTDKELKMYLSDGSSDWLSQKISLSFRKGLKASQILGQLLDSFNIEIGEIILNKDITYYNGKVFNTTLYDAITEIVKDSQSKIYIKQGTLFIRPDSQGSVIGFNLRYDTGLIGSPNREDREETINEQTITKTYYKLDCLLNHRLTVGTIINVESKTLNGRCIVTSGEHASNFVTSLEVVSI